MIENLVEQKEDEFHICIIIIFVFKFLFLCVCINYTISKDVRRMMIFDLLILSDETR